MIAFDVIRGLREARHWSQEEMAERLGMSKNGYEKIERGESNPNIERLSQIATIFNVDIIEPLRINDRNLVVQTHNHSANYHQNHYAGSEALQVEIERLNLIIVHKDELLAQKDEQIRLLKKLANIDNIPLEKETE